MMTRITNLFKKKDQVRTDVIKVITRPQYTAEDRKIDDAVQLASAYAMFVQKAPAFKSTPGVAMDSQVKIAMDNFAGIKAQFTNTVVPNNLINWYASQSFIGFPLCAMMSQHWLVGKSCLMPAEDAMRRGYEVTVNDGTNVSSKVLDRIREYDEEFSVHGNLEEFIQMGRVFGIRIAFFDIDVPNPKDFYYKPFNIDGVPKNSYRGISQIDPYWVAPILDSAAAANPASINFYRPTWWLINGMQVHRSHLIIFLNEHIADIIKPTYQYGSIPLPQRIYERVYDAERTASEAPLLAMTKRTDVIKMDTTQFAADEPNAAARIGRWVNNRNNFGIKVIANETEDMMQFDTSLADLDEVIMSQYQLVAAIANVPAVKLLGTSPKGFNSTGEHEESSYHEFLQTLQRKVQPMLQRHHDLIIKSFIAPAAPFKTTIVWKPLDAMTAKEQAEVNKTKAETGQTLMATGAIDGQDERDRIIADPDSGYTGLTTAAPEPEPEEENDNTSENK